MPTRATATARFVCCRRCFATSVAKLQFQGPVSTVKCFEDNTLVKAAVESPGQGRVLVVDGGGSLRRALVGGNLAAAAAKNGWAGLVVDGAVRDVAELAQAAVGIKALAAMPLPTERRNEGQRDIAVRVQGLWVRPGDWLVADADGIVVLGSPSLDRAMTRPTGKWCRPARATSKPWRARAGAWCRNGRWSPPASRWCRFPGWIGSPTWRCW